MKYFFLSTYRSKKNHKYHQHQNEIITKLSHSNHTTQHKFFLQHKKEKKLDLLLIQDIKLSHSDLKMQYKSYRKIRFEGKKIQFCSFSL